MLGPWFSQVDLTDQHRVKPSETATVKEPATVNELWSQFAASNKQSNRRGEAHNAPAVYVPRHSLDLTQQAGQLPTQGKQPHLLATQQVGQHTSPSTWPMPYCALPYALLCRMPYCARLSPLVGTFCCPALSASQHSLTHTLTQTLDISDIR